MLVIIKLFALFLLLTISDMSRTEPNQYERCGHKNAPGQYPSRIVGGTNAIKLEWPWIVYLLIIYQSGNKYQCGATLITDRWLLTAAHCLLVEDGPQRVVARFGALDILSVEKTELNLIATPVRNGNL